MRGQDTDRVLLLSINVHSIITLIGVVLLAVLGAAYGRPAIQLILRIDGCYGSHSFHRERPEEEATEV